MSDGSEKKVTVFLVGAMVGLLIAGLTCSLTDRCNITYSDDRADETWKCVEYAKQTILNPDWIDACCVGDQGKFCVDEPDNPDEAPSNIEQMEIDNETVNYTECRNTDRLVARNVTSICLTKKRR